MVVRRAVRFAERTFAVIGLATVGGTYFAYSTVQSIIKKAKQKDGLLARPSLPPEFILDIDLEGSKIVEKSSGGIEGLLAPQVTSFELRKMVKALAAAADDTRVKGVVSVIGSLRGQEGEGVGFAQIQELRDAVLAFRRKTSDRAVTLAYSESFGESGSGGNLTFYLASAFEKLYMQDSGLLSITGFSVTTPFLRRLLDKLDVVPIFFAREEYKNAANQFTHSQYSDAHKAATQGLIDSFMDQLVKGVAENRNLQATQVWDSIRDAPLTGPAALSGGLIDGMGYRGEVNRILGEALFEKLGTPYVTDMQEFKRNLLAAMKLAQESADESKMAMSVFVEAIQKAVVPVGKNEEAVWKLVVAGAKQAEEAGKSMGVKSRRADAEAGAEKLPKADEHQPAARKEEGVWKMLEGLFPKREAKGDEDEEELNEQVGGDTQEKGKGVVGLPQGPLGSRIHHNRDQKAFVVSVPNLPRVKLEDYIRYLDDKQPEISEKKSFGLLPDGGFVEAIVIGPSRDESGGRSGDKDKDPKETVVNLLQAPRIGLITATGNIVAGKERSGGLQRVNEIASTDLCDSIRRARDTPSVKAVVLRVDSRGGSAVASDAIYAEVKATVACGKPVVVSMGNYAASGGYFISAPATKIVANPATITGSIGVIAGKFNVKGLVTNWGVDPEAISGAPNANVDSPFEGFTAEQESHMNRLIDTTYDSFLAKVAEGRKLSPEAVREAAKGRVWTGEDALKLGLVDKLGGLNDALALAKEAAGIDAKDQAVIQDFTFKPKEGLQRFLKLFKPTALAYLGSHLGLSQVDTPAKLSQLVTDMLSRAESCDPQLQDELSSVFESLLVLQNSTRERQMVSTQQIRGR